MNLKIIILLCLGLLLLSDVVSANKITEAEIYLDQSTHHFNPKPYYNERHDLFAVRVGKVTFGNFRNSFNEPTRYLGYVKDYPMSNYWGYQFKVLWINGYSDARNILVPVPSLYLGDNVRFNVSLLPGAISWGWSVKVDWK